MNDIIRNPARFINFFKWHGYYAFYNIIGFNYYDVYTVCSICAKFNERIRRKRSSAYQNIAEWWNADHTLIETTTSEMPVEKIWRIYRTLIETANSKMPVEKNLRNHYTLIENTTSKMPVTKNLIIVNSSMLRDFIPNTLKILSYNRNNLILT